MRTVHIRQKLEELGYPVERFSLGEFDEIGELTAKKKRDAGNPMYRSVGAYHRPNYERGLLIYALIRAHKLSTFFEIGFGRGYGTLCAAKAFSEGGAEAEIVTLDMRFDQDHLNRIYEVYPKSWFEMVHFLEGDSHELLPQIQDKFDLIYIDGDHSYEGTKADWTWAQQHAKKFVLFDDYHLNAKPGDELACALAINEIQGVEKELIIMDRRIFADDRRYEDEKITYGQVLVTLP